MAFAPVFGRVLPATFDRHAAVAANWYDGLTVAYQAKGAVSYAASKINLANPGTYDASDGTAYPTFGSGTGWTFNGSTQYLSCGVVPFTETWTAIIRFANATNNGMPFGVMNNTGGFFVGMRPYWTAFSVRVYYNFAGSQNAVTGAQTAGTMAIAGANCYLNGTADGTIPSSAAWAANRLMMIGALGQFNNTPGSFFSGDVVAFALKNATLTAGEVATVSAAMAAL